MSRDPSLSPARKLLRDNNIRRALSQNFLIDADTARMLVRCSGIDAGDLVVEIGPGDGMLTRRLLGAAGRVLAYEKDHHYATLIRRRYAGDTRIQCWHSDIRAITAPREQFAVVANIPFAASTDIVRWCLDADGMHSATLLTQWEFARKYAGDYGRWPKLTVRHWPTATMALGPRVGRHNFHPIPRVDAGVLMLRKRRPLLDPAELGEYHRLVELGFTGRGGSLAASLRRSYPGRKLRAACASAGIALDEPVGLVSPDRWLMLYQALRP